MGNHNNLGIKGEEKAKQFLVSQGYEIIEQNWRYRHKEIDIIAKKDKSLVIVEVKTRSSDFFDDITTVISKKKKYFLIEATEAYINQKDIKDEIRFDLIFIHNDNIEHIKEAFNAFDI